MKCTNCGQIKPTYHFYMQRGISTAVTKFFFINPEWHPNRCWVCNGNYRCLGCGLEKGADQFRVGGRICHTCKSAGIYKVLPELYTSNASSMGVSSYSEIKTPTNRLNDESELQP